MIRPARTCTARPGLGQRRNLRIIATDIMFGCRTQSACLQALPQPRSPAVHPASISPSALAANAADSQIEPERLSWPPLASNVKAMPQRNTARRSALYDTPFLSLVIYSFSKSRRQKRHRIKQQENSLNWLKMSQPKKYST
jgi:hypothetical protein